jgi:alcohol dehydrogenase class IV
MTPFAILAPPRLLFGRGQSEQAASAIAGFGAHPFLVHGRVGTRAAWLITALRAAGATVTPYACPGEPDLPGLEAALAAARSANADCVVALGGGAAIDLGKAVAALLPAKSCPLDHLEVVGRGLPLTEKPLPFIALPTTAGTGAEATKNAVIDVPSHRRKVSLRDDRMIAQLAIIDPALTDHAPRAVTLASGLDAITQVIEPYLCTRANAYTDALCRTAIPLGLAALHRLMQGEDPQARDQMAWVSLSGGLALANSGLGAVHGFAGAIGGATGAAHGAICGALLPHVLAMNMAHAPSARMDEVQHWLAQTFGAKDGIAALQRWSQNHGLPNLAALGLQPKDHHAISMAALEASSMKANPFTPSLADLAGVLAAA